MKQPLWIPSKHTIEKANITRFIDSVNTKYKLNIHGYNELYKWSIENIEEFWRMVWEFGDIQAYQESKTIVDDLTKLPGAKWFPGARLNFAENLLRHQDESEAFVFKGETRPIVRMSYSELYNEVNWLSKALLNFGIRSGDRIAAYMPNIPDTAIAMLATTSIGGVWSSCGTGLGPKAVRDRFEQIEPTILFTVDSYSYKGKDFDVISKAEEVAKGIPSLEKIIVIPYIREEPDISPLPNSTLYNKFVTPPKGPDIQFEPLPFDHPLYIMFSSGTTGKPKCMVQSAGGVLLQHIKYQTEPSWMMWNWMLSSLAVGATLLLYDGNPNHPDWRTSWKLIQDEKVTIFGCSATYLNYLKSVDAIPGKEFDLSSLKEISQTGSALSAEGFQYVYDAIKEDLHFNSISGGTDINGCFAAGSPIQPVFAGELQGPALAMKIKAYDENQNSILDREGELVCEAPAPSMPLYFWNDPDGKRYRDAYFNVYPNVWHHGDYIIIHSETGGVTFLGRSDFTLKPSGVRIGPSEIYNVVEEFSEISDSIVVGQNWQGDQRILLFVKLSEGIYFNEELKQKIETALRVKAGPRHVPAHILEVQDIPYTFSMKKVESAIWNIANNRPVTNIDAIGNPNSLEQYHRILLSLKD
ncbi:MAG: acetoacetate--CoA ligase [Candidatus Thorarchaeota archaeon]|jgi:acetoacetyl-CoA synthetase